MWIKQKNQNEVRGKNYDRLINITTGITIFIDIYLDQPEDDLNLTVWGRYPGLENPVILYRGTEVECINVINQFASKLNAKEVEPWAT